MDCVDMAQGPGEFIEGQGMALVDDFLGHGLAGTGLRGLSLSRQHLENHACWYRLVLFWPEHGRKSRHPGFCDIVVRGTGANSLDPPGQPSLAC